MANYKNIIKSDKFTDTLKKHSNEYIEHIGKTLQEKNVKGYQSLKNI